MFRHYAHHRQNTLLIWPKIKKTITKKSFSHSEYSAFEYTKNAVCPICLKFIDNDRCVHDKCGQAFHIDCVQNNRVFSNDVNCPTCTLPILFKYDKTTCPHCNMQVFYRDIDEHTCLSKTCDICNKEYYKNSKSIDMELEKENIKGFTHILKFY
jgi:hypothetical protein